MTADTTTEVLSALRKVAPEIDAAAVDRRTPLTEQFDLDSMDLQRFLAALGARYQLDIPDADVPGLTTVEQIVAYLDSRGSETSKRAP